MARSLQHSSQDALPRRRPAASKAARLPRWRKCLTIVALLCAVGLYSDAVTHHHTTLAQEIGCPVCHVVSHNPLTVFAPPVAPAMRGSSWFHSSLPGVAADGFRQFLDLAHRSRAPPVQLPSSLN
jgi:hypothetical protein